MPDKDQLKITRRCLPHWQLAGSVYFVTFRVLTGSLSEPERRLALDHLKAGDQRFYRLFAAVIMPDHVHAVLQPSEEFSLSRIMKGVKGVSARLINTQRGTNGRVWQDESYDRILRDDEEFLQKVEYLINNPVRAALCANVADYDFWFCHREACFGQTGMSAPLL